MYSRKWRNIDWMSISGTSKKASFLTYLHDVIFSMYIIQVDSGDLRASRNHKCVETHSCIWHDSFMYVTWLIHICAMAQSFMWRHSCVHIDGWVMSHTWMSHAKYMNESWHIYDCAMSHGSVIYVTSHTWRSHHLCDINESSCMSYVTSHLWHKWKSCHIHEFMWRHSPIYVTQVDSGNLQAWRNHICVMTHSCVWHDSFIHVTWLINRLILISDFPY